MTPVVVSSVTPLRPCPMRLQYCPSRARLPRSASRMTAYSSESASVVSGTAPSASNRVPRWTSRVASPPSSSSMLGPATAPDSSRNSKSRWVHHQYSSSVSPFQANTGTPAGSSGVPPPTTIAAAAWSWVEKMLQLTQRTSAPSDVRVSMRTAVCTVMCSDPAMRAPARGCSSAYSARRAMRPGISCSAREISLRPKPARERSATLKSPSANARVPVLAVMSLQGSARPTAHQARRSLNGRASMPRLRRGSCRPQGSAQRSGESRGGPGDHRRPGRAHRRAGRHERRLPLLQPQLAVGRGERHAALEAEQHLRTAGGEDAAALVELHPGEVEVLDRHRVAQPPRAEHRVYHRDPAVGEVEDLDERGEVDVLGGQPAAQHVVGAGHDLDARAGQVRVQVAGRQEHRLTGGELEVVAH